MICISRFLIIGSLLLPCSQLPGATLLLFPSEDSSMFQTVPNNNLGSCQSMASGGTVRNGPTRMMLKFDLEGQIPAGAIVTGVKLDMTVTKSPPSAQASTFGLHRLLVDWGEGTGGAGVATGTGRLATTDEASWNNRFHPSVAWGQAGGQAGVDYASNVSGTAPVNTGAFSFASTPGMVADVNQWVEDPSSNFGWMVISQSETTARTARRFGSRENPTLASRPILSIEYFLLTIADPMVVDDSFQFTFMGQEGASYEVQSRDVLGGDFSWTALTNVGPLAGSGTVVITDPIVAPARFYQIQVSPVVLEAGR